jgi:hypothetical protein
MKKKSEILRNLYYFKAKRIQVFQFNVCFLTFWIFLTFDMFIFLFDCFAKTTFECVNL